MNIILSTLQHAYTINIPTPAFRVELAKRRANADYTPKLAASHDVISIKPGFNNFDDALLERLNESRAFTGLLDSGKVFINNRTEENRYNSEVKHLLHNNKEYAEAKKRVDLERENESQKKVIVNLQDTTDALKKEMSELRELLKTKSANPETISKSDVKNDNAGQHKK